MAADQRHRFARQQWWQCMPPVLLAVAAAAALLGSAAAQQPNTLDINDSFQDYNVVPAGRALYYDFVAYNYSSHLVPDVLVTVKSSGAVDIAPYVYCNPAYYSAMPGNSVPGPNNAIYSSEEAVLPNTILIDAGAEVNRPENARDPNSAAYHSFVPAYNCSVVSNDAFIGTRFTIDVSYQYRNVALIQEEQNALLAIWKQCCAAQINSSTIRVIANAGEDVEDDTVEEYRCGRWAQNNVIYGGNATTPFTDFCQIAGNACTPEGRLYKLDFNSYGLVCPFVSVVDNFASLLDLESLDLSDNFDISGPATDVFQSLSTLQYLQILDISGVTGLEPPLTAPGLNNGESGLCLLVSSRLKVLNMAEIGLQGAVLPDCLFSGSSTIEELRMEFNSLSGSLPDVFTDTSPLRVLTMLSTNLTGSIPPSLSLCKDLEILDLAYNELSGTIPADLGNTNQKYLRFVYLQSNNLSGAIPEDLALAQPLEALDVSLNRLSGIPASWQSATTARVNASPLRNINLGTNLFTGGFPAVFPLLPDLTILQMFDNRFTGTLPAVPGMFTELRVFNVTKNQLTGTIPSAFGSAGIFRLDQVSAVGTIDPALAADSNQGATLTPQAQIFDVSRNSLSGAVPTFLYANNVKTFVRPYVNVRYNKLTVRCDGTAAPGQLQYLANATHLCPQYPPPGALAGAGEGAADALTAGSQGGGGGGLPAWATALIVIGATAVFATVVGFVGLTYFRARARGEHFTAAHLDPRNFRRRGFKQFNDLEMTSGMDPLGFGAPTADASHPQLNGMANGTANGTNGHAPPRSKRGKGGFL